MSNAGYFYFALQSAKGTANTSGAGQILPVTNQEPTVGDMTRTRAPTIGAKAFPQGSYKGGTAPGFSAATEVPGKHIGFPLYFLSGEVTVTAGSGFDGAEVGVDTYDFTMATDDFTLPYVTVVNNVDGLVIAQAVDCIFLSGRFIFAAGGPLTVQLAGAGITPSFGTEPASYVEDTSPILVCSTEDALMQMCAVGGVLADVEANQVIVDLVNNAAPPAREMKIGSPYRRDVTVLSRAGQVTMRKWVDADEWKNIYFGGSTTWSASPYSAEFLVQAASGATIVAAGTNHYGLKFAAEQVDFAGLRAPQPAQDITVVEMTGSIVVPSSGEEFTISLASTASQTFDAVPS